MPTYKYEVKVSVDLDTGQTVRGQRVLNKILDRIDSDIITRRRKTQPGASTLW